MESTSQYERPEIVEEDHLYFLDMLRDTGVTNMYGAGSYLEDEFGMNRREANEVLSYWMKTFSERQAQ